MNAQLPPATQGLIVACIVMFVVQWMTGNMPVLWLALWPIGTSGGPAFWPWQLVTYSFLHGGIAHLFFNMFALFMFGGDLERLFGTRWYLSLYFVSVVAAAVTQLGVAAWTGGPAYPTIGASGGVFGLLLTFGMYFPNRRVMLIFPPIPMPAWLFVTLYGALELYLGLTGAFTGVAHFAHLGGMAGAYLMIRQRRGRNRFGR